MRNLEVLERQALQLRYAVRGAVEDVEDLTVPADVRLAAAREALEALGELADRLLAGVVADAGVDDEAPVPVERKRPRVARAVH